MQVTRYFDRFPTFEHDTSAPILVEFKRLSLHRNWKIDSKRYRKNLRACLREEFSHHYGTNQSRLDYWQSLCMEVGVLPAPSTITQCKKVAFDIHSSDTYPLG